MEWTSRIKGVVVGTLANACNATGSLSCIVSGATLALAYSIDDALHVRYYGAVNTMGNVELDFSSENTLGNTTRTLPIDHIIQEDGIEILSKYIPATTIRQVGFLAGAAGFFLKSLGVTLQTWQEGVEDSNNLKKLQNKCIQKPSIKEYLYANAASACDACSTIAYSNALIGSFIYYSGESGSRYSLTYPFSPDAYVQSPHYNGPVKWDKHFFEYISTLNLSLDVHDEDAATNKAFNLTLKGVFTTKAQANVTLAYGGGMVFDSKESKSYPAVPQGVLGFLGNVGTIFFNNKRRKTREIRVHEATSNQFLLNSVDNLSV